MFWELSGHFETTLKLQKTWSRGRCAKYGYPALAEFLF